MGEPARPPISAFNLKGWIDDNRHLLKPPMLNKPVWRDQDFIVMILAGPIIRNDFHVNPYEEFFYQLEGDMSLLVIEEGEMRDIAIPEGNVFLLPPGLPHSPQRQVPGSIGLVVERNRRDGVMDHYEWYCDHCTARVHHGAINLQNIAEERGALFTEYYDEIAPDGVCLDCGEKMPQRVTSG